MSAVVLEPPPQAVFFDLDDTLCDYASARDERLRIAFTLGARRDGAPLGPDTLSEMIATSIRTHPHGADHFQDLFATFGFANPAAADTAAGWYRSNRFHGLRLFPLAADVLRYARIAKRGEGSIADRPVAIITNGPGEVQRAKLRLLGLERLVDFAIVSEELGFAKPEPEIFEEALHQAGIAAHEAVYVGDSPEFDVAGARRAGIPVVWHNAAGQPWNGPGERPNLEIASIGQLPELIGCPPAVQLAQPQFRESHRA